MKKTVLFLTFCAALASAPAQAFRHLDAGQEILPLSLSRLTGESLKIDAASDQRATVLVFWATWSPRSLKALTDCQELYGKFGTAGLRVIGVNVEQEAPDGKDIARAEALARSAGVTYPLALDQDLSLYSRWGVVAVPSAVLVDAKGRVVQTLDGYAPVASFPFKKRVQEALAGVATGEFEESAPPGDVLALRAQPRAVQ